MLRRRTLQSGLAAPAGMILFASCSLLQQVMRGLEGSTLLRGDGVPVLAVNGWWLWIPGVVALGLAMVTATLLRAFDTPAPWLVLSASMVGLTLAGVILAITRSPEATIVSAAPPALWLIDGAANPATWVLIGATVGTGLTKRRRMATV